MTGLDIPLIRAAHPVSSVVGGVVALKRAGRELVGSCPFHKERSPSFTVNDEKQFAHCFGCGWHGDVLDFIQAAHGVGLVEAAERLGAGSLPVPGRLPPPPPDPDPKPERDTVAAAVAIWRAAMPAPGTLAETYLRWRGLHLPIPASIRFAMLPYGSRGAPLPCLVALVASVDNKATGIHRIYLRADGRGKANIPKPKLSLGRVAGGAIRLAAAAAELIVCEGLEDGLTLQQETGRAVWAAAGSAMLPSMRFPEGVRLVSIGRDNDETGVRSAAAASEAFTEDGRAVRIFAPLPEFKDFNAELQGTGW